MENAPICKANDRLGDILFSAGGRAISCCGKVTKANHLATSPEGLFDFTTRCCCILGSASTGFPIFVRWELAARLWDGRQFFTDSGRNVFKDAKEKWNIHTVHITCICTVYRHFYIDIYIYIYTYMYVYEYKIQSDFGSFFCWIRLETHPPVQRLRRLHKEKNICWRQCFRLEQRSNPKIGDEMLPSFMGIIS